MRWGRVIPLESLVNGVRLGEQEELDARRVKIKVEQSRVVPSQQYQFLLSEQYQDV